MKRPLAEWLSISGVCGLIAPAVWFVVPHLGRHPNVVIALERLNEILWPSAFWLMATDGIEGTPRDYFFVFLSVGANVLLYAFFGAVLWCVRALVAHGRGKAV